MSGPELKPCPFCGGAVRLAFGEHTFDGAEVTCDRCGCYGGHHDNDALGISAIAAWNTRTPDPAQIRADAIREAMEIANEAVSKRTKQIEDERRKPAHKIDVAQTMRWGAGKLQAELIANEIAALLATPLSPTAVDGSPVPDAGGKEGV